MTGPEHYRLAEGLLGSWDGSSDPNWAATVLAAAQVQATLALAAAFASARMGEMPVADADAWYAAVAAGSPSNSVQREQPHYSPQCGAGRIHQPGCTDPSCDCACHEPDEPPEAEFDPGPEVDDQGGMSEYRHAEAGYWPDDLIGGVA